jgi:hypothetical protein
VITLDTPIGSTKPLAYGFSLRYPYDMRRERKQTKTSRRRLAVLYKLNKSLEAGSH